MAFKRILRYFLFVLLGFGILALLVFAYLFVGSAPKADKVVWGVGFSQKYAENLGLDWKETYLALLDELGVKNLRVTAYWDLIESERDKYNFSDLDWQIEQAKIRVRKIVLVIGMKTPRWPECHIPNWVKDEGKDKQQEDILSFLKEIVGRYKNTPEIIAWQIENEPFFNFGICPWQDDNFFKKEVDLVRNLDSRPILVSETGEWSFWIKPAKIADIIGISIYRIVWVNSLGLNVNLPLPPVFYWRKEEIIKYLFGKKVIVSELQMEPWGSGLNYNIPLAEQEKTMNLQLFKKNIEYAKATGFDTFYMWGAEWWYWLKEKQGQPEIWAEAKSLFK